MSKITLRPRIEFSGDKQPDANEIEEIHHDAQGQCFVGNSLKTEIVIEAA